MGRTALILSGGGMFGAYQAGVWRTLWNRMRPDIIIGASIGSINGYAMACGTPPESIERMWLDTGIASMIQVRFSSPLAGGLFDAAGVQRGICDIMQAREPRIDFGAVIVEAGSLRPRLVCWPRLRTEHLLASCSLPGALPPVWIDGVLYCDGAFLQPTPVWAARQLGADRIISVDVMPRYLSGLSVWIGPRDRPDVTRIAPLKSLGSFVDMMSWDRDRVARSIDQGHRDAEALLRQHWFLAPAA